MVGRVVGQDAAYPEEVNTAYLSPQARGPHWVKLRGDSKAGAYAAVQVYAAGLRHAIGKPAVHFVLAAYPGGNFFALLYDHMFLEAGSRELVQTAASTVYLRPETTLQNYGCGSWARYVRHAMRLEADVAFWEKEFAPSARLQAFHTTRRIGAEADVGVKLKKRHVVLELPLGQMSQALGVSVPLLAESAFCLAVSLYWSQIGGRTEPAYYAKTISRERVPPCLADGGSRLRERREIRRSQGYVRYSRLAVPDEHGAGVRGDCSPLDMGFCERVYGQGAGSRGQRAVGERLC